MKRLLIFAMTLGVTACGELSLRPDGSATLDTEGGHPDGGPVVAAPIPDGGQLFSSRTPGNQFSGVLRGASGCNVARAACDPASEYVVSVACHGLFDGGQYAVNGVAGSWCYPLPTQCHATPTCRCLTEFGAYQHDGGTLDCPGNYFFCLDQGGAPADLHCNPP